MIAENNSLDENYDRLAQASPTKTSAVRSRPNRAQLRLQVFVLQLPDARGRTHAGQPRHARDGTRLDARTRRRVKNVVFIDDTFNVPLPRFKDICRMMIRKSTASTGSPISVAATRMRRPSS